MSLPRMATAACLAASLCGCRPPAPCTPLWGWDENQRPSAYEISQRPPLPEGALLRIDLGGYVGRCPDYEVTVYADGRVAYVGHEYVRAKGAREHTIDAEAVAEIREAIEILAEHGSYTYAFATHARWGEGRCSFARKFDYLRDGEQGLFVDVVQADGVPQCIRALELRIVELSGATRWTGGDPLGTSPTELSETTAGDGLPSP